MSESILVILGSPLPLSFTTPDGSSGRFIRAAVFDSAQAPVAGSPFVLTEVVSTGRYAAAPFTPGAVGTFTAHFTAYTDGTFTIKLTTFDEDQDSFSVLDPALFGYLAADRTRDNQIAVETAAIDGRLPPDPADESVQLAAHAATQGAGFVTGTDSLEAIRDRGDAAWVTGSGLTPQQARDAMKLAPSGGVPAAGSIDDDLDIMKGAGFATGTDSLEEIRDAIDLIPTTPTGSIDVRITIPPLERPPAVGTEAYDLIVEVRTPAGVLLDPDANTLNIAVANQAGTSRSANLSAATMTKIAVGRYRVTYNVADTHAIEELVFTFTFDISATAQTFEQVNTVIDATEAVIPIVASGLDPDRI